MTILVQITVIVAVYNFIEISQRQFDLVIELSPSPCEEHPQTSCKS